MKIFQCVQKDNAAQRGNVLFLILIVVALFAALSFAVTYSSRNGKAHVVSDEKTRLLVSQIMQNFSTIKLAVDKLILRGCVNTQISFRNNVITRFPNATSPSDHSCEVYHSDGGGMSVVLPTREMLDPDHESSPYFGQFSFEKNNKFHTVDTVTTANAVEMIIPYVSDAVCLEINRKLFGISSIPTDTNQNVDTIPFNNGAINGGVNIYCENTELGPPACGHNVGCFKANNLWSSGKSGNLAYMVVLKR